MTGYESRIENAAGFLSDKGGGRPFWGVILGSGLGGLASRIQNEWAVNTRDIPGWPVSTVSGHEGRLVFGHHAGCSLLVLEGRVHLYEGYSAAEVGLPVRVLHRLGVRNLVLTNAAGGLNPGFHAGDIMLISDHINLMPCNPLAGYSPAPKEPRFPDLSQVYDPEYLQAAADAAGELSLRFRSGILVSALGPGYETPAEVRMMRRMGGDAVCMSTVPEAMAAVPLGLRVLGLSLITNAAAGLEERRLSHEDVQRAANRASDSMHALILKVIEKVKQEQG